MLPMSAIGRKRTLGEPTWSPSRRPGQASSPSARGVQHCAGGAAGKCLIYPPPQRAV